MLISLTFTFFPQTLLYSFLHVFIQHIPLLHVVPFSTCAFCYGEKNLHCVFWGVLWLWPSAGLAEPVLSPGALCPCWESAPVRVRCFPTWALTLGRGGSWESHQHPNQVISLHLHNYSNINGGLRENLTTKYMCVWRWEEGGGEKDLLVLTDFTLQSQHYCTYNQINIADRKKRFKTQIYQRSII